MIRPFNHDKFLRFRRRRNQSFQLGQRSKLVARSADKQLRLHAFTQEIKRINSRRFRIGGHWNRRNANSNQGFHPRIRTRSPQSNCRAERESRK